jgi:hypothetical protein
VVESFDEAIPFLIIFAMWGLLWPAISRYKSIHEVPRKQLVWLSFGMETLGLLFIYTLTR